jgi:hypothetical protein
MGEETYHPGYRHIFVSVSRLLPDYSESMSYR